MNLKKIWAVYFSGTGTTKKTVLRIADDLAAALHLPREDFDFSLPQARQNSLTFTAEDLVVFGVPVYAGRVPNVLLPYLKEKVIGGGALAVPVVLYGNRDFDDALLELRNVLTEDGFAPVSAAAFIGEHSFSRTLGAGRPDEKDFAIMDDFAARTAARIASLSAAPSAPIAIRGKDTVHPYYVPKDKDGKPISILKVKPKTDLDKCTRCGFCAAVCPMGSINPADVSEVTGICIKCCACVKGCPTGAKYYDDAGYLYHQHSLEENFARRAEPELFF